jgi:superfamily II DNA or RNA helicase
MIAGDVIGGLSFRWTWRPYQERVLRALRLHVADGKLHIVAAPGAGKTTLGLEAFRQLGKPALALSPTRGIRDQWITRLTDFLPRDAAAPPPWASVSLDHPGVFTSVTYQALHATYREGEEDAESVETGANNPAPSDDELTACIARLKAAGIGTLILDEAHHLRAEWWKALTRIVDALAGVTLVSLTATPPYDVMGAEWERYEELCGAIDEEISIPELVKSGTLCPHQDYVWLVTPSQAEKNALAAYDATAEKLCGDLLDDAAFRRIVRGHPWVADAEPDAEAVLDEPEVAVAMLMYLAAIGDRLPRGLSRLLDTTAEDLPALTRDWWQTLVRSYLFDEHWLRAPEAAKHREALAKRLRADTLLWRRELRVNASTPLRRKLSLSPSKIEACVAIHRHERAFRGADLRQVILVDFVGDDTVALERSAAEPAPLGAWPVFRALAGQADADDQRHMGLLTGRLAVLHEERLDELRPLGVEVRDLPSLPGFKRVSGGRGSLIEAFTALLAAGKLRTLTGTRSLLGEGWDAPCINSLILCSFVGSFMLTNQMRGRAIRVQAANPGKTSSIWHIAAVDTGTASGLGDVRDLQRRFDTFVGLGAEAPVIENGLERMALAFFNRGEIAARGLNEAQNNARMLERLRGSAALRELWQAALEKAVDNRVVPCVAAEAPPTVRPFHFLNTFRYLLYQMVCTFLGVSGQVMQGRHDSFRVLLWVLMVASGIGFVVVLPKLVRAAWILIRHLPVDGAVRQIGLALRDALCATGILETAAHRLPVVTRTHRDGSCSVSLGGAEFREQAVFADCLGELLGAIENPRYLLTRHSLSRRLGRLDYHAVPVLLGVKKERAEALFLAWQKRVGPAELLYTRSPEGRRMTLLARAKAFSTPMTARARRLDRWQ